MKKRTSLWPMMVINRFEKSCGTFRRGGRKNHYRQRHWVSLPNFFLKNNKLKNNNNNDRGWVLA
jgi:hypothetical protein